MFDNPWLLLPFLMLTIVSSWYAWRGFQERNVPDIVIGLGISIPTFGIGDWRYWAAAVAVCAGGRWLRGYLEG